MQLIYDPFAGNGGTWPTLGDLQRALKRQGNRHVDAFEVVQRIPPTFLNPLSNVNTYPAPAEKLILTIEGIERCTGSGEDIENFLITLKLLVRWTDRSDLAGGPGEDGIRFTVSIHGVPGLGCQLTAGSGGSQGFPSMTARTASSAVVPCAAAE
ncbi:MAG: hypothetical protein M3Z75_24965, partial [Actinomycetota bacterium]|nr:hypothetical protein [Actinomycetota bacterium]